MSLAVDEYTDIGDVPQLNCNIMLVNDDGCVSEEFLTVLPLLGRTSGEDIFNVIMKFFKDNSINIKKLVSVATDGAPSMVGRQKGLFFFLTIVARYNSLPLLYSY